MNILKVYLIVSGLEMNPRNVKRYYEIKQKIKGLEAEAKVLNDEIKDEMLSKGITDIVIGNYEIHLQRQDRSEIKDTVIPYLKEKGYSDLIVETYDRERFKELEKRGSFDENELKKHRIDKIVYALFVKPIK